MKEVVNTILLGALGFILLALVIAACADQIDCWSRGGVVVKSYALKGYSCIPAVKP